MFFIWNRRLVGLGIGSSGPQGLSMWSFSHLASGCFFPKKRFDRDEMCEPCSLIRWEKGQQACGWSDHHSERPLALPCEALRLLHGTASDREWDNIKEERNNAAGVQAKSPWELFTDRTIRWQLLTIVLLNTAQQLNGINAVRTPSPSRPADRSLRPLVSSILHNLHEKAAEVLFLLSRIIFCRSTSTQITCFSKQGFPVTKYLTWPLAPVPVNASRL